MLCSFLYSLKLSLLCCLLVFSFSHAVLAQAPQSGEDTRPLSPAQIALFETPHLSNVVRPETLRYTYRRVGPSSFKDTVAIHVREINPDGSKNITFNYLTDAHRVMFPEIDQFRGNPLLMLVLQQDVAMMKTALGVSEAFFRNRIRESFVDAARVSEATTPFESAPTPATIVTIQPFAHETRLERIPSLQAKTYTFILAERVPGMVAEIRIDTPEDAALHAPALSEQITFAGVEP